VTDLRDFARRAVERAVPKIDQSAIFLGLLPSENMAEHANLVIEFGLAVLLDKPIYLLVPDDLRLPSNLTRLAHGVERYRGPDDIEAATARLLRRAHREREDRG